LLDLSAIQNGTVWQTDWIAMQMEGLAGMIWSDLIMMRRALDALTKIAMDEPSFSIMRDTIALGYHFRRGDYAAVVRAGEQLMQGYGCFSYLGWVVSYGQIALSYLELGNVERALSISEQACRGLDDDLRQYAVTHFTLESAYAAALIASGQRERGQAMFQAMIERLRASGDNAPAILMHEYRVKASGLVADDQL
jgi:hypothetical protein